ncbi:MAG: oligosaccharide flippase family protein [Pseudomonadota bacterium]
MQQDAYRQTAVDVALTFSRQFVAAFFQLAIVLIVAQALGPSGTGMYAVALLLPSIFAQLLSFGLPAANVYLVASNRAQLDDAWSASRDLMICVAIAGLLSGWAILDLFGTLIFPDVPLGALIVALLVFPSSLFLGITNGFFQALQDFRRYNFSVMMQPTLALAGVLFIWLADELTLFAIIQIVCISYAISLLFSLWLLSGQLNLLSQCASRRTYWRSALAYGVKAHLTNLIAFLNHRLDLFLVSLLVGPAAAGLYAVAVRLVEQLWMVSKAVSTVILPRLSAMVDDEEGRRKFTPVVARTVLWTTLAGSAMLAFVAEPLVILLFENSFVNAVPVVWILLPGVVLLSCSRVLANDLAARGRVDINLALTGGILIVNLIGNLFLIPLYGVAGAAAATTIAYAFNLLLRLAIQNRLFGTRWTEILIINSGDLKKLSNKFADFRTK